MILLLFNAIIIMSINALLLAVNAAVSRNRACVEDMMDILRYEKIEFDIIEISADDIIRTSNDLPDDDWGGYNSNSNPNG